MIFIIMYINHIHRVRGIMQFIHLLVSWHVELKLLYLYERSFAVLIKFGKRLDLEIRLPSLDKNCSKEKWRFVFEINSAKIKRWIEYFTFCHLEASCLWNTCLISYIELKRTPCQALSFIILAFICSLLMIMILCGHKYENIDERARKEEYGKYS